MVQSLNKVNKNEGYSVKEELNKVQFIRIQRIANMNIIFYLPNPSTVHNTSFKGCRRVMPGDTINITSI